MPDLTLLPPPEDKVLDEFIEKMKSGMNAAAMRWAGYGAEFTPTGKTEVILGRVVERSYMKGPTGDTMTFNVCWLEDGKIRMDSLPVRDVALIPPAKKTK